MTWIHSCSAAARQRPMSRTARGPGCLDIKAASYELLRKLMKETHFFCLPLSLAPYRSSSLPPICSFHPLVSTSAVSVSAALVGPSSRHLAGRHADRRVHRPAFALAELQRPPSQRSEVDLSPDAV